MKKFLVLSFALMVCTFVQAQDKAPSPKATSTQIVGLTEVSLEYSRPGVKGRKIYAADGLVPFGSEWRTGANSATKISFSDDVTIQGQALKAGSYAITTVPGASKWTVHFHEYGEARWSNYKGKTPALAVTTAPVTMSETVESFMIVIDGLKDDGAEIGILWENTYVPLMLGVK